MPETPGELDLLRAYLRDRDVTCPICRHNLRGAAGFACPECGGRLDLHVVSMDMPHKWWITCVLAFAIPLGLVGTFAGAGTWAAAHARLWPNDKVILAGCWGATVVCLIGLAALLRRRTRFIQKPLARQRTQAILWSILGAGFIGGLIFAIVFGRPWWY